MAVPAIARKVWRQSQLAEQLIPECYHLVISCNAQGQLAQFAQQQANSKLWLLPEACHDRSFAMTSSFTGMLVSTLLLLTPDEAQSTSRH